MPPSFRIEVAVPAAPRFAISAPRARPLQRLLFPLFPPAQPKSAPGRHRPGVPPANPVKRRATSPLPVVLAALSLGALVGCRSAEQYAENADRDAYEIVAARRAALAADAGNFSIERPADNLRAELLERPEAERALEPLDLARCLEIASENARNYQSQRETLFLTALDLTLERFRFAVQTGGSLGALVSGDGDEATDASVGGSVGFSKLLGSGAAIVGGLGLDLFRSLLSSDGWDAVSTANFSITQPLLAGFGRRIVEEPLTQAERNVVYAVRSYERFRRSFAFDVASRVYRILQQHDNLVNEQANYDSLEALRRRNEALAQSGRLSEIQVDQARQDVLRAESRLIDARQRLEGLYDDFKLFLGLPVETRFELDAADLVALVDAGIEAFDVEEHEAIALALELRLDHQSVLDRVDDAERRVYVAKDALRGVLDVEFDVAATSEVGKPLDFRGDDVDWSLGLNLDLPFERLPQRNAYRERLIGLESARRDAEESRDGLLLEVRAALRELTSRRQTYEIQLNSTALAERRVESTRLNFEAGRAETRDLLEAQNALLEARNALTSALVDHRLAALALYRDMELLRVDEGGLDIELEPLVLLRDNALPLGIES